MLKPSNERDGNVARRSHRVWGTVRGSLGLGLLVVHAGILVSSCAARPAPIVTQPAATNPGAKGKPERVTQALPGEQARPRLSLPPAEASPSPVKVATIAFSTKRAPPVYIASILGNNDRVWLLSIQPMPQSCGVSSLYESDGKRIRLVSPAICAPGQSIFEPCFVSMTFEGNSLELLGISGGGCGVGSESARRRADGTWRCERDPSEYSSIRRFWSAGELTTAKQTFGGEVFDFGGAALTARTTEINGQLAPRTAPVAIAKGGVHAWALIVETGSEATHLVEWTGLRWRERADVLPEGIGAEDIVAMAANDSGADYLATRTSLLVFDGTHFIAHAVPQDFSPEYLVPTQAQSLWVLGCKRAWHYQPEAWSYVELPMTHVHSHWLAPKGTLWIAGSDVATQDELESSETPPKAAVVATLALTEAKETKLP